MTIWLWSDAEVGGVGLWAWSRGSQSQHIAEVSVWDGHHEHDLLSPVSPEVPVRKSLFGRAKFRCLLHDCAGNVCACECLWTRRCCFEHELLPTVPPTSYAPCILEQRSWVRTAAKMNANARIICILTDWHSSIYCSQTVNGCFCLFVFLLMAFTFRLQQVKSLPTVQPCCIKTLFIYLVFFVFEIHTQRHLPSIHEIHLSTVKHRYLRSQAGGLLVCYDCAGIQVLKC